MTKKVNDYATFVALDAIVKNSSSTFTGFRDEDGTMRYIAASRDQNGNDVPYRFKFSKDKRFITVPLNKKDINGNSWVEFLRDHPYNQHSPSARKAPWYKELDNDRDAEIAIDSFKLRNKAESIVLKLKGKEFDEVCNVLGFRGTDGVKLHKLMQYATRNPTSFLETFEDPNRRAAAVLRAALVAKVVIKHGFRYMFKDVHLGNDEEKAIAKVAEDKELLEAIQTATEKAG